VGWGENGPRSFLTEREENQNLDVTLPLPGSGVVGGSGVVWG
jgi:hypothetical protein